MTERLSDELIAEVKRRANDDLPRIVGRSVQLKRRGREFVGLCPFHHEKGPSFTVVPGKRMFHCFGCGAHGDAVGFAMRMLGVDFPTAVRELARELGISDAPSGLGDAEKARRRAERLTREETERAARAAEEARDEAAAIAWCRAAWDNAKHDHCPHALEYLASRGIRLAELPPTIRCARAQSHRESGRILPCMVAAIQDVEGRVVGIHRTFLDPTTARKADVKPAKKMNGRAWGGAVRLSPPAPVLVLGEGIETVLSVIQSLIGEDSTTRPRADAIHPRQHLIRRTDQRPPRGALRHEGTKEEGRKISSGLRPRESDPSSLGVLRASSEPSGERVVQPFCFWAGLSLGNLAGRGRGRGARHPTRETRDGRAQWLPSSRPDMDHPGIVLPVWVERVILLADQDNGDPDAAEALLQCAANRFRLQGKRVEIMRPPEGMDFNDVLNGAARDEGSAFALPASRSTEAVARA